jgi:hypothetical protein
MTLKLEAFAHGPVGRADDVPGPSSTGPTSAPAAARSGDGFSAAPPASFFDARAITDFGPGAIKAGFVDLATLLEDLFHPKVTTGLGADVDAIVNQSLQLRDDINALKAKGYSFQFGAAGGGTFTNRGNQIITVDPNGKGSPAYLSQLVAHEVGHAQYPQPRDIPPKGLTHDQFIKANVDQHLRDEGAANFENCVAREQILAKGGTDIGINGTQQAQYLAIYADFKAGKITKDQAIDQMGQLFANETTSNTGENYRVYYGKEYERQWQLYQLTEAIHKIQNPWWPF